MRASVIGTSLFNQRYRDLYFSAHSTLERFSITRIDTDLSPGFAMAFGQAALTLNISLVVHLPFYTPAYFYRPEDKRRFANTIKATTQVLIQNTFNPLKNPDIRDLAIENTRMSLLDLDNDITFELYDACGTGAVTIHQKAVDKNLNIKNLFPQYRLQQAISPSNVYTPNLAPSYKNIW